MSDQPVEKFLVSGNATKAGLPETEELARINAIIGQVSRDSRFSAAQERKAVQLQERIRKLKLKVDGATSVARRKAQRLVDGKVGAWMAEKDKLYSSKEKVCFVCVDMDAFYAACEALRDPSLASVPMAVGNTAMLSTANYEARKFGVSAGMPGYLALRLCPQLKLVDSDFDLYREKSAAVSRILATYDAGMHMFSLDEAFLRLHGGDGGDTEAHFARIVQDLRQEVFERTGLTCSAGLALNARLAKMASNINKPNGQFMISLTDSQSADDFLSKQPVRKVPGIGKVMASTLEGVFNVYSCADLWSVRHLLPLVFKEKTLDFLLQCSFGHVLPGSSYLDVDDDECSGVQKSIGCERTFKSAPISGAFVANLITKLLDNVFDDAASSAIKGFRSVGIKAKSADFHVSTRERALSRTFSLSPDDKRALAGEIAELVREFAAEKGAAYQVRLIGVRLSKFVVESSSRGDSTLLDHWISKPSAAIRRVHCPICDKVIADSENEQMSINMHIDHCLSAQEKASRSAQRKKTALDLFVERRDG